MATLDTFRTRLTQKLGRSTNNFWTQEKRDQAINDAILDIVSEFSPRSHIKRGSVVFASGKVAKPADYLRMVKLWDPTTETIEFQYIPEDEFDQLADTASYYWTEDYDTTSSTRKLYALPTTQTTTNIRYVFTPTILADGADTSDLESDWTEAVALKAAARLFEQAGEIDIAQETERLANKQASKANATISKAGGVKQREQLRSKYKKVQLLTNRK